MRPFKTGTPGRVVNELHFFVAAIQQYLAYLRVQRFVRRLYIETEMAGEALDDLRIIRIAPVPAADSAACEAYRRIAHDPARIEKLPCAEAIALRAGADGVVERK